MEFVRPAELQCAVCGKTFEPTRRAQGGGRRQKYCSKNCCAKGYTLRNPDARKATILRYESVPENQERKHARQRRQRAARYGWKPEDVVRELTRQQHRCNGCRKRITERSAHIDHNHRTGATRGLLCRDCNHALGFVKDNPATLRRLMAYLEKDRSKQLVYVGGALKNPRVPEIGNLLRAAGYDAMDEWWTPGKEADENWQHYERLRGRTYEQALRGRSAQNVALFDRAYIDLCDAFVLVMPAGKSAMLELGYARGSGKPGCLFLDGDDPERYDVMPEIAAVAQTEEDLLTWLAAPKTDLIAA